jgi:hypothetical protein
MAALGLITYEPYTRLRGSGSLTLGTFTEHPAFRLFEFSDWFSKQHFVKQFFSGIFIVIVMTGLDQDMMQKNLSCKSLSDAQKNMYWYGFAFIPINFLFLLLGLMLIMFASQKGITLPAGNFLDGSLTGKKGITYNQRASVCLETQKYPDTPNKPEWPSAVLRPGEKYTSQCIFKFSVDK